MSHIFDLMATVSADATPFNDAMDTTANSVGSSFKSIGQASKQFIGMDVVQSFMRATDAAYNFDQILADISSISEVNINSLSKSIKQLDNVYGNVSTVSNSIYNIISSGFDRSEQELLSIVENVGQASKSIRADLYSTANVFTTVANAYDVSADSFKDIADLLFVTVKEGKAEGDELARTLGLVVNTASEAGLSFAEMSAVISTLSRTQTTSQAMIGFNQMLNAMIKPSKEAAVTAEQYGIELSAAALKSKGFTAIIKEMHDKLQGNVEAINKISGPIRAMRAVISLTGKQYENFIDILEKAEDQIGTGVAMEAFAKQTNTAKQALENLKVQLDKTFVNAGQDLEPLTRHVSEFAEIFLKTFGSGKDWSLGGLGRWSAYISGVGLAIKGVVSSVKLLKNFSTSMVRDGNSLTSSSNTFAANVERAQRALQMSAASISAINTRMSAVALPDQHRMEQRALHPSPAMIKAQAQENINAMYLRNAKGSLYDPSTGRLVSERKLLADEIARLKEAYKLERAAITKQVRRDAAVQRYNRRFGTNYGSYDDVKGTRKLQRWWKALGANKPKILTKLGANITKGLTKFGTGLLNVSLMLAAWETGWAIGTAIGKKLKLADTALMQWIGDIWEGKSPGSTRKQQHEIEQHNIKALSKSTSALIEQLHTIGQLNDTERDLLSLELSRKTTADEIKKLYDKLRDKYAKELNTPTPQQPSETEQDIRDRHKDQLNRTKSDIHKGKFTLSPEERKQAMEYALRSISALPEDVQRSIAEGNVRAKWNKGAMLDLGDNDYLNTALKHALNALSDGDFENALRKKDGKEGAAYAMVKNNKLIKRGLDDWQIENLLAATGDYFDLEAQLAERLNTGKSEEDVKRAINAIRLLKIMFDAVGEVRKSSDKSGRLKDAEQIERTNEIVDLINRARGNYTSVSKNVALSKDKEMWKGYKEGGYQQVETASQITDLINDSDTYSTQYKAFEELRTQYNKLRSEAQVKGVEDRADVSNSLTGMRGDLTVGYTQISTLEKDLDTRVSNIAENIIKRIESETSDPLSATDKLDTELKTIDAAIKKSTSDRVTKSLLKLREILTDRSIAYGDDVITTVRESTDSDVRSGAIPDSQAKQRNRTVIHNEQRRIADLINTYGDIKNKDLYGSILSKLNTRQSNLSRMDDEAYLSLVDSWYQEGASDIQQRKDLGRISESGAARETIKLIQRLQKSLSSSSNFKGFSETEIKLTSDLNMAFKELADNAEKLKSSFMNTIQGFTSADNRLQLDTLKNDSGRWTHRAVGKMSNDALWHSINLASRMGNMVRSRPYTVDVTDRTNRNRASQLRNQAQQAMSASVDSWIMSQKYAQANVGKTVTDIYSFMKQNNVIVVRN